MIAVSRRINAQHSFLVSWKREASWLSGHDCLRLAALERGPSGAGRTGKGTAAEPISPGVGSVHLQAPPSLGEAEFLDAL